MGGDAAALPGGLFEVDQLKSFTNFGAAGLKFALLSFVHFDVDGHGTKNVTAERRRGRSNPKVFVSKRHCGNHATGLCDVQRCGRKTHWISPQLQHVLADLRPFPSACACDGERCEEIHGRSH